MEQGSLKEFPLFLPEGSIRAVIAVMFVVTVLFCTLTGKEVPGEIYAIFGVIIHAYYDKTKKKIEDKLINGEQHDKKTSR